VSGLVVALSVTPGGRHDATEAHPLITCAQKVSAKIREVLADAAYGGMRVRNEVLEATGVTLLAPPLKVATNVPGKADVDIDFVAGTATCPGGVSTGAVILTTNEDGRPRQTFLWPKGSEGDCSCAKACPVHRSRKTRKGETRGPRRRVDLHPDEQELRRLRAEWATPAVRERYRARSQGERLIHELTRRGARQASGWGLRHASLQAHCVGLASNLRVLGLKLAGSGVARVA